MYWNALIFFVSLLCSLHTILAEIADERRDDVDLNDLAERQNTVKVNKCCLEKELMVDARCRLAARYSKSKYHSVTS